MFNVVSFDKPLVRDGNMREMVVHRQVGKPSQKPILTEQVRLFYFAPIQISNMASQELAYIASQMRSMNGPLSYYRTSKARFDEEKGG